MKNINVFQIIPKIRPFIRSKNAQRETDERPYMYCAVSSAMVVPDIMNLGMAVMAAGNTIVCTSRDDLLVFKLAVRSPGIGKSRLQETTTTAAAVVIRFVWRHFNNVIFANYRFDNETQILGYFLAISFANDLTGILNCKGNLTILVPVGIYLKPTFTDPLSVILVN